ncbi:Protein of unknown function, partial [Cotesia congregata]
MIVQEPVQFNLSRALMTLSKRYCKILVCADIYIINPGNNVSKLACVYVLITELKTCCAAVITAKKLIKKKLDLPADVYILLANVFFELITRLE